MLDLERYSEEQLVQLRELLTRTRGNPLESLAAIFAFTVKVDVDRELDRRRQVAGQVEAAAAAADKIGPRKDVAK